MISDIQGNILLAIKKLYNEIVNVKKHSNAIRNI